MAPEVLSTCEETVITQTRNQQKRYEIKLLVSFMPVLAQSKNGIPHVAFLSGSIKGEL